MGNTIGVDVDERDHIFIVHRNSESQFGGNTEIGLFGGVAECCTPAPPIIEFDLEGNIVNAFEHLGESIENSSHHVFLPCGIFCHPFIHNTHWNTE